MNVDLMSLWLPIVVSAVAVFIASSIVWMVLPHHKSDYGALPDENAIMAAFRAQNVRPGMYCIPSMIGADGKPNCKDPAFQEKLKAGPWATFNVMASWPNMGRSLGLWFVYLLVIGAVVAFVAGSTLAPGAPFRAVFQLVTAAAFLPFACMAVPQHIWKGLPASIVVKEFFDGVAYALITGAVFAWLWPDAAGGLPLPG